MVLMKRKFGLLLFFCILAISLGFIGCEKEPPSELPEAVAKRFYGYISEGGPAALDEAYKMIAERDRLGRHQFTKVIKRYPPDFYVSVVGSTIEGDIATVKTEYRMSSLFGGDYKMRNILTLVLDDGTNSWKVDFTGETHEEDKGHAQTKKVSK